MCLGWHVKGMCNEGCRRQVDHARYLHTKYQALQDWYMANYSTSSNEGKRKADVLFNYITPNKCLVNATACLPSMSS